MVSALESTFKIIPPIFLPAAAAFFPQQTFKNDKERLEAVYDYFASKRKVKVSERSFLEGKVSERSFLDRFLKDLNDTHFVCFHHCEADATVNVNSMLDSLNGWTDDFPEFNAFLSRAESLQTLSKMFSRGDPYELIPRNFTSQLFSLMRKADRDNEQCDTWITKKGFVEFWSNWPKYLA